MVNASVQLKQRFVNDFNFPIQVVTDPYFLYQLDLQEEYNGALSKWEDLMILIENHFNGNGELFLEEYRKYRDIIITDVLNKDSYKKFIGANMGDYVVKYIDALPKSSIYNQENDGKYLISVDLKKANFQSLKYYDPEIINNTTSYEKFIETYLGNSPLLKYFQESKYSRQVIFGKLNPARQITVEKYIMSQVLKKIKEYDCDVDIINFTTDEIIIKYNGEEKNLSYYIFKLQEMLDIYVPFELHVKAFKLEMLQFLTSANTTLTCYVKHFTDGSKKLMSVPAFYFSQVYKLWKEREIDEDKDLVFYFEHNLAKFLKPLEIKK